MSRRFWRITSLLSRRETDGIWGHVLVSLCACVLTVSIVGSIVFLAWRVYDRQMRKASVQAFVASLENRTPEELSYRAEILRERPRLAKSILPAIVDTIKHPASEQRQRSAIEISRTLIENKKVERALFKLRLDQREIIASSAIDALSHIQPPKHAAEVLGNCLADAKCSAAVDQACAGLFRLGEVGRIEMNRRLMDLGVGRRVWLVGYIQSCGGAAQQAWLTMMSQDTDTSVHEAARKALSQLVEAPTAHLGTG